ncbi:hypothetical protein ACFYW6_22190 [Streptomyces sp. NPDC002659]
MLEQQVGRGLPEVVPRQRVVLARWVVRARWVQVPPRDVLLLAEAQVGLP